MSSPSNSRIQNLLAKLNADPSSKIFLPLAEQYRSQGNLDRAAQILRAGLKHNPGYSAAQVALARVFIQQGDVASGRRMLTDLIVEVPDNLLAGKLLEEVGGPMSADEMAVEAPEDEAALAEPDAPVAEEAEEAAVEAAEPEAALEVSAADPAAEDEMTVEAPEDEAALAEPDAPVAEEAEASNIYDDLDCQVPEAEDLGFHVNLDHDLDLPDGESFDDLDLESHAAEDAEGAQAPTDPGRMELESVADGVEAVWTDPDTEPAEPPVPEPGVWKSEPSGAEEEAGEETPYETVRLDRSRLTAALEEYPVESVTCDPVPEQAAVAEAAVEQAEIEEPEAGVQNFEESLPAAVTPQEWDDEDEMERTLNLARLYRRQGRLDMAADIYRDVLDGDPEHQAAKRELSEICGENVPEITDEDLVPEAASLPAGVQMATSESLEDARQRKIAFLRSWLEHIRQDD